MHIIQQKHNLAYIKLFIISGLDLNTTNQYEQGCTFDEQYHAVGRGVPKNLSPRITRRGNIR